MISRYAETYAAWQRDPLNFWAEAAKEIDWIQAPQNIFDAKAGVYGLWFPDATCNTCWNALDRHVVAGQGGTNCRGLRQSSFWDEAQVQLSRHIAGSRDPCCCLAGFWCQQRRLPRPGQRDREKAAGFVSNAG